MPIPTKQLETDAASVSEVNTGTNAVKFVTPDSLAGSNLGEKSVSFAPFKSNKDVVVGNGLVGFVVPSSMDGMNLVDATASVYAVGTTNTTDIQIRRSRAGVDVDMLSTPITISSGGFTASDGVVDTANDDLATGDIIFIDVDATSTTKAKGLFVVPVFRLP